MVVENGPERVRELNTLGVSFNRDEKDPSRLDLGREGGHSARRIAHSLDLSGREIERALLQAAAENPRVNILEDHLAVDLLIASKVGLPCSADNKYTDRCLGALGRSHADFGSLHGLRLDAEPDAVHPETQRREIRIDVLIG